MNSSGPNLLALQRLDFSQAALVAQSTAQGKPTVVRGDSHAHHNFSIPRRNELRVVESVIALSGCLCSAREYVCLRLLRSIASKEITICSILLIMGRCQKVRLNRQFRCCHARREDAHAIFQQKDNLRWRPFPASQSLSYVSPSSSRGRRF